MPSKAAGPLPRTLPARFGNGALLLDGVIDRGKQGFGVPMARWLRGELRELARDVLTDKAARDRGYLRAEAVARLLDQHNARTDNAARIWNLLQLELWHRTFVDASSPTRAGGA